VREVEATSSQSARVREIEARFSQSVTVREKKATRSFTESDG
jgi:hypothetical protein